jgi:hypothetical protein
MSALFRLFTRCLRFALKAAILTAILVPARMHADEFPPGIQEISNGWSVHSGDNPA